MSRLLYFRHAQASYGKADYDQLSDKGYVQSEHLGEHLVQKEVVFQAIYVGPLKRHHQTLSRVQEAYDKAGAPLPQPVEMKELEEHRGPEVLKRVLHLLKEEDELIGKWEQERTENPDLLVKNGLLIFDRAMELWATGAIDHHHPPQFLNWSEFRKQVKSGYQRILEKHKNGKSQTIGLFTSGGTISATMGYVLGINEDKNIIRLNGIVQNTSISEVLFSGHRVTLKSFNEVPHLPDELKTFV